MKENKRIKAEAEADGEEGEHTSLDPPLDPPLITSDE